MNETSIASARASVMIYDDINKKWVPSGGTSGLSKVHIFQHNYNTSFRVVGRKLHDHEVVINCIILPSVKYNQATETFHQWRDNKQIYGLNFSSKTDADAFAKAMSFAVEVLAISGKQNTAIPPIPNNNLLVANSVMSNNNGVVNLANNNQPMQQPNGQCEEDMGYRTMTKEDMAVLQERRSSQQQQQQQTQLPAVATTAMLGSPNNALANNNGTLAVSPPQQPTSSAGHQRTLSAPPAPQPPPMALCTASIAMSSAPPAAPAPPCPPPLPNTLPKAGTSLESDQCSLAAQLQSARLRRSNRQSAENSGSSTTSSSSGGSSNYSTLGRNQNGMASMMDEMAKTLARRRAAVEKKECSENVLPDEQTLDRKNCVNSSKISLNGCESPKPTQKTFATSSEELILKINGESNSLPMDLENLKQEILQEMKKEINNMKQDIIEFMRQELNKR